MSCEAESKFSKLKIIKKDFLIIILEEKLNYLSILMIENIWRSLLLKEAIKNI